MQIETIVAVQNAVTDKVTEKDVKNVLEKGVKKVTDEQLAKVEVIRFTSKASQQASTRETKTAAPQDTLFSVVSQPVRPQIRIMQRPPAQTKPVEVMPAPIKHVETSSKPVAAPVNSVGARPAPISPIEVSVTPTLPPIRYQTRQVEVKPTVDEVKFAPGSKKPSVTHQRPPPPPRTRPLHFSFHSDQADNKK